MQILLLSVFYNNKYDKCYHFAYSNFHYFNGNYREMKTIKTG
jgi:hypothetical protein